MSIRELVQDALFLAENGRHLGALTVLMAAVAGSSKKTFPKGTKSREKPEKEMSDRETFTLFLGGRIHKLLLGGISMHEVGKSGINVEFEGKSHDIADILYKYYRCELIHDGSLPENVEFASANQLGENTAGLENRLMLTISTGNKLSISHSLISLLVRAVTHARCNGREFGIEHFDLKLRQNIDEETFLASLIAKYETTEGRVSILKFAAFHLSPCLIANTSDDEIIKKFQKLVKEGVVNMGAISGLSRHRFTNDKGRLEERGINLLRDLAKAYERVRVE